MILNYSWFILWFALAPIASLIEFVLFKLLTLIGNIPYGFGTALFAFLWQPLVIIGWHTPLGVAIDTSISSGTPQLLGTVNVTPYWGQLGAVVALAIITKNMSLRKMAFATVPAGIFGITEPIIYGVNLPRVKPFIYGCVAASVRRFLIENLDLDMDIMGTFGILSILRFNDSAWSINPEFNHAINYSQGAEIGLVFLTWSITFTVGFLITFFFYKERKNELSYFKKAINKIIKFTNSENKKDVLKNFQKQLESIKNSEINYKKTEKYYSQISKIEVKLAIIEEKKSKIRNNIFKKLNQLKLKLQFKENEKLYNKFQILNNKYSTFGYDTEKNKLQNELTSVISDYKQNLNDFNNFKEEIILETKQILKKFKLNKNQSEQVQNIMWNAINSVEICFEIFDSKNVNFKKREQ
ncbi:beta-glucoside PTS system IIABC component [Spiroplasma taiwanense]|uniref:Beta-glucoside PTS system IIABC component n=1 Tax=Spiroplasma taiwanense CT-1 TaxID=1276220 RepID=S5MFX3_9MOLU|nr:beta-glucoside PTS system IIABC component [Spiroplasma taiwanense]AGR40765.1 beta-glucoside PTS system IIABC component [Spiroplasma taiwanense CT-1]